MESIIGRELEIEQLQKYIGSRKAEFIAIYGRRRVGKTYLVRQLFQERLAFDMSGVINGSKEEQIGSFIQALRQRTW